MYMVTIPRSELPDDYKEMMEKESHHDHPIIDYGKGVIRWKVNPTIEALVDLIGLNEIIEALHDSDLGKNSEIYRDLYRSIGYSLSGYWEIFYWDMNNPDADDYQQPTLVR